MFEKPDLYNVDCMEAMKEFPDKFFDLAIVDPPYGINADTFNNGSGASKDAGIYGTAVRLRGRLNSGGGKLKNCILNKSRFSWDNEIPPKEYFEELKRVSKNQVIWGGQLLSITADKVRACMGQKASLGKLQSSGNSVDKF